MSFLDDPPLHNFPDRALRRLLEDAGNLRDQLTAVAPDIAARLDFTRVERLDRSFRLEDWRGRESDLLFRIPYRTGEGSVLVCVLLEHQSQPDPRMPLRLLVYAVLFWEREWKAWEDRHERGQPLRLTPVLPVVLHTGSEPWGAEHRSLGELFALPEEFRPFVPRWHPLFWDLAEQDATKLVASASAWLQALAVVRAEKATWTEFEPVLEGVIPRLDEFKQQERVRGYDLLWFVLSWISRRRPRAERARVRDLVQRAVTEPERRREVEQMSEALEQTWEQWVAEREQRAEARGTAEGRLQACRDHLRAILTTRFDAIPPDLESRIAACNDVQRLEDAFRQALQVSSIDEVVL